MAERPTTRRVQNKLAAVSSEHLEMFTFSNLNVFFIIFSLRQNILSKTSDLKVRLLQPEHRRKQREAPQIHGDSWRNCGFKISDLKFCLPLGA